MLYISEHYGEEDGYQPQHCTNQPFINMIEPLINPAPTPRLVRQMAQQPGVSKVTLQHGRVSLTNANIITTGCTEGNQ